MCGIAGYIHFDSQMQAQPEKIKSMTDVIAHRGPDAEGYFVRLNLAFGHRRLSIIDLVSGAQPMHNEDKSISIIFNGEIYVSLRSDASCKGS